MLFARDILVARVTWLALICLPDSKRKESGVQAEKIDPWTVGPL